MNVKAIEEKYLMMHLMMT